MLGRMKYAQLSYQYPSPVLLRLSWLWKSGKDINHQVLITFQQKWFSQEVEEYVLRYVLTKFQLECRRIVSAVNGVKYCAY